MNGVLNIVLQGIGAIYILFIPGLAVSLALFRWQSIEAIERVALSLILSVAVVPLVVFYLSIIGVKISLSNVIFEVAAVTILALVVAYIRRGQKNDS
jgi:uncharacterized membrane protein